MDVIFGLAMFTAQIRGTIIIFGGHKDAPKGLRIAIGIGMILFMLGVITITM